MKSVSASVGCVYTMLGHIAKLVQADLLDLIHQNKYHAKADRLSKKWKVKTVSNRERLQEGRRSLPSIRSGASVATADNWTRIIKVADR